MWDDWDDWGEEGWTMIDDLTVENDPDIYLPWPSQKQIKYFLIFSVVVVVAGAVCGMLS